MAWHRSPVAETKFPASLLKQYGATIPQAENARQTMAFCGCGGFQNASYGSHKTILYIDQSTKMIMVFLLKVFFENSTLACFSSCPQLTNKGCSKWSWGFTTWLIGFCRTVEMDHLSKLNGTLFWRGSVPAHDEVWVVWILGHSLAYCSNNFIWPTYTSTDWCFHICYWLMSSVSMNNVPNCPLGLSILLTKRALNWTESKCCLIHYFLNKLQYLQYVVQFLIFPWIKLPNTEAVKCERTKKYHLKFEQNSDLE